MMTKIEKINRLNGVLSQIKSEFVGLDSIIDEIGNSITPWYVTPEIIERPVVVSLWGMTGTGKSSVVKRLIELLDLKPRALMFDCGEESNDGNTSVSDKICEYIQADELDVSTSLTNELVFVFDEFQYARTIDEQGIEVTKANLRPVWSLMDSGIINLNQNSWDIGTYCNFVEDLAGFVKEHPGIKVKNCEVRDKKDVKTVLNNLGLFYFDRGLPGFMNRKQPYSFKSYDDGMTGDKNPYRPLRIIEDNIFRILVKRLKTANPELSKTIIDDLVECETIDDIVNILQVAKGYIMMPKYLNCSNSIVFIIGNLDEAFRVEDDINPDLDADMFYNETSKVSISDIKEALKKRFRAEQIARFGNSIIKYPTLKKEHFKSIISKEVDRVCNKFSESNGFNLSVAPKTLDLIYAEGVYPVQGVRPIFTTIGTILTPLFSKILIYADSHNKEDLKVVIDVPEYETFKKSTCKIEVNYYHESSQSSETVDIPMSLGGLRDPKERKTRVINSVHEAGHAVVMAYLTGLVPVNIVSVSTDHGGFCITHNSDKIGEIKTKQDVANDVCIALAGYEAEMLFFGDRPEMTLCGSSSDIENAWKDLSEEIYTGGYFVPYSYTNYQIEEGSQIPAGFDDADIRNRTRNEFSKLRDRTKKILRENSKLIAEMAEVLSAEGNMNSIKFKSMIGFNKGTLTLERLEKAKQDNSPEWYETQLNKFLKK